MSMGSTPSDSVTNQRETCWVYRLTRQAEEQVHGANSGTDAAARQVLRPYSRLV